MVLFRRGFIKVFSFAVLFTLILQIVLISILKDVKLAVFSNPYKNIIIKIIIELFCGIGFYAFIYNVTSWAFDNKLWIYLYPQLNINGIWYHVLENPADPHYVRYGRIDICQKFTEIKITGTNYGGTFSRSDISIWRSESIECYPDGFFSFNYSVTRSGPHEPLDKRGNMQFKVEIEKKKPLRLVGNFQDTHPSNIRGSIIATRDAEWKRRIPSTQYIQPEVQPQAQPAALPQNHA